MATIALRISTSPLSRAGRDRECKGTVRVIWDEATSSLYSDNDPRIERVAAGFALLLVTGKIMEIDTASAISTGFIANELLWSPRLDNLLWALSS